ncbi:MAG: hypothetical protein M3Y87_15825 [Myxococcota bacterium]|nr:hypothetical protein [Myxococcota bacterium]
MRASFFCFVLLLTACEASHPPADTDLDAASESDAGATTSDAATAADGGGACAEEGEACVLIDGVSGRSNCCISRHTCFPDGCRY